MSTRLNNLIEATDASVARLLKRRELLINQLYRLQGKLNTAQALQARYRKKLYQRETVRTSFDSVEELKDWNGVRVRTGPTQWPANKLDDPLDDIPQGRQS